MTTNNGGNSVDYIFRWSSCSLLKTKYFKCLRKAITYAARVDTNYGLARHTGNCIVKLRLCGAWSRHLTLHDVVE